MKKYSKILLPVLMLFFTSAVKGQRKLNDYLGQVPPSNTPAIFAKGIVSDGVGNRDMAISPDGNEIFYTLQFNRGKINVIMFVERKHGKWLKPAVASFSGVYGDLEPAFSPDGHNLYFTSDRPVSGSGKSKGDFDIWYVTKQNQQWGNPKHLDAPINSDKDEYYPSVAKSGNLYFTREMENGKGNEDIVVSYYHNGIYSQPESLSDSVNTPNAEFNAFVDPDERFIIFSSYGRKDNGGGDLYISWKNKNGQWGTAKNLPQPLNSPGIDYCPFVSPDKKYFFFTSNRTSLAQPFNNKMDISELRAALNSPGNGLDDIYWVSFDLLLQTR